MITTAAALPRPFCSDSLATTYKRAPQIEVAAIMTAWLELKVSGGGVGSSERDNISSLNHKSRPGGQYKAQVNAIAGRARLSRGRHK